MADDGELPGVGMECLFKHGGYDIKGVVTAITNEYIVLAEDSGKERIRKLSDSSIKPLTPPIELIEKGLYLFDVQNKKQMVGEAYFTEIGDCWMITNIRTNTSYEQSICTNIKLLTPEVSSERRASD